MSDNESPRRRNTFDNDEDKITVKDSSTQSINTTSNINQHKNDARFPILIIPFALITLLLIFVGQSSVVNLPSLDTTKDLASLSSIDPTQIIKHVETMIDIGNSDFVYENSKAKLREYIRDYLVQGGMSPEQIFWHRFEWQQRNTQGRNITTTTWTGINIVIWSNTTEVPLTEGKPKIRVFGAHYDTVNWGENKSSGAHDNLAGTALLMELLLKVFHHQRKQAEMNKDQTPYLFVLFDHEEPGALGSKTFVDYYKIGKMLPQIAYFVDVDSIGYKGASPIIQTYPYEDKGNTLFSPRWLTQLLLQAAYYSLEEGMNVGHHNLWNSIYYQAFRYHLISVPFLSDDGPFSWTGVPSVLFTDLDVFFDGNVDYHQPTDLPVNLDTEVLQKATTILSYFVIATEDTNVIPLISDNTSHQSPFYKFLYGVFRKIQLAVFPGIDQYMTLGPFSIGSLELAALSVFMLFAIFVTSFPAYRELCKKFLRDPKQGTIVKLLNHRLLFLHLVFLLLTVAMDTVFAFIMILYSFPALMTLYKKQVNVVTAVVSCILCVEFWMRSIAYMEDWGQRGSKQREFKLGFLIVVYALHSLLVLVYGWDYFIKNRLKPKTE